MSDLEPVPELTPDLKRFLDQHSVTGEPTEDELSRVKARLAVPVATVTPLRVVASSPRRFGVPVEVLAAAAVLLVLLGAQGGRWYLHEREENSASSELKSAVEAYRAGDFEGAARLASQGHDPASQSFNSALTDALGLSKRLDALSPQEIERLSGLDAQLAQGTETPLSVRISQRKQRASAGERVEAAQLLTDGLAAARARDFVRAVALLERCVVVSPATAACYRVLGSTWAEQGDEAKSRAYYERFLELASPDDEDVPKVRALLTRPSTAAPLPAVGGAARPTLLASMQAARAKGDWLKAVLLARDVQKAEPNNPDAATVLEDARNEARELYLRGYQLRETSPREARGLFKQVVAMTPADDDQQQKALSRLEELAGAPAPSASGEPDEEQDRGPAADLVLRVHGMSQTSFGHDIQRVAVGDGDLIDVSNGARRDFFLSFDGIRTA
jgi:tetratricopeptide (TPR) repeat protein